MLDDIVKSLNVDYPKCWQNSQHKKASTVVTAVAVACLGLYKNQVVIGVSCLNSLFVNFHCLSIFNHVIVN